MSVFRPSSDPAGRLRPLTATNRTVAQVNSTVLLNSLRRSGPVSRADLAGATGLSMATVNRLVDRLMDEGLMVDSGQGGSTGGRPPKLVAFNSKAQSVMALDVGARKISGALADLDARVYARQEQATDVSAGESLALGVFDQLVELAEQLMHQAIAAKSPVRSIAVGVPGIVRQDTRRVEFAPALGWHDVPLASLLEERLGVPVRVENDVNLLALAEHRRGVGRTNQHIFALAIGTGVGSALILDGRLYGGGFGAAGEVGYLLLDRASLAQPWPGFGDLESRVGALGVIGKMRREVGPSLPETFTEEDLLALIRAGDESALRVFAEVVDELALAIGNVATILNPELVVLGGGFGKPAGDLLIPAIERRLQGRIPMVPRIVSAELDDAQLIGAAELAVELSADSAFLSSGPA